MHQKYGPIIRINPYELHVETPSFYDEVFAGPGKIRNRWAWSTTHFGIPQSVFGTLDHNTHRIRRAAIQPFFSKRSVRSLQPIIDERIDKFMQRFVDFYESGETMTISLGFAAFTNGGFSCAITFMI
jgi:cytochrome P450